MSDLEGWIQTLFKDPKLLDMGHAQSADDLNLGMGWLYYGLVRSHRVKRAVVIGSYRGFVPMVLARALQDNQAPGEVIFIDPSLVDDFWRDPEHVNAHFAHYGINTIRHYLNTTQEFIQTPVYDSLSGIDLLFVDGYHTYEQAKFDHEAFLSKLANDALVLFHDSVRSRDSGIYGSDKRYQHTVFEYMNELKQNPDLQVMDFHYDSGLTIVKKAL